MLKLLLRILDFLLWLAIKLLPNKLIIKIIILSPWKKVSLKLSENTKLIFRKRIINFFKLYDIKTINYSNCLSRSILCKIILDCFHIPNQLNFGINFSDKKTKILHAWLSDPSSGYLYTKGLNNNSNNSSISFK